MLLPLLNALFCFSILFLNTIAAYGMQRGVSYTPRPVVQTRPLTTNQVGTIRSQVPSARTFSSGTHNSQQAGFPQTRRFYCPTKTSSSSFFNPKRYFGFFSKSYKFVNPEVEKFIEETNLNKGIIKSDARIVSNVAPQLKEWLKNEAAFNTQKDITGTPENTITKALNKSENIEIVLNKLTIDKPYFKDFDVRDPYIDFFIKNNGKGFFSVLNSTFNTAQPLHQEIANYLMENRTFYNNDELIAYLQKSPSGIAFLQKVIKKPEGIIDTESGLTFVRTLLLGFKDDSTKDSLVNNVLKTLSKTMNNAQLITYLVGHGFDLKNSAYDPINDVILGRATTQEAENYLALKPSFSAAALLQANANVFSLLLKGISDEILKKIKWKPNKNFKDGSLVFWLSRAPRNSSQQKKLEILTKIGVPDDNNLDPEYNFHLNPETLTVTEAGEEEVPMTPN